MTHCWIPLERIESENFQIPTGIEAGSNPIIGKIEIPEDKDPTTNTVIEDEILLPNSPVSEKFEIPVVSHSQIYLPSSKQNQILFWPHSNSEKIEVPEAEETGTEFEEEFIAPTPTPNSETNSPEPSSLQVRTLPKTPKYSCPYVKCSKIFFKPSTLNIHIRGHTGDKPYICTWPNCTWRFTTAAGLARHFKSHTGDKPFQCEVCLERFTRSDYLSGHRERKGH